MNPILGYCFTTGIIFKRSGVVSFGYLTLKNHKYTFVIFWIRFLLVIRWESNIGSKSFKVI